MADLTQLLIAYQSAASAASMAEATLSNRQKAAAQARQQLVDAAEQSGAGTKPLIVRANDIAYVLVTDPHNLQLSIQVAEEISPNDEH